MLHSLPRLRFRLQLRELEARVTPSTSIPLSTTAWTAIGPAPINNGQIPGGLAVSGRITALAAHPTDANTIYVAAAGGGVWKTTNAGTSWTPLTDTQQTLAMGAIAVSKSNPNVIYAGTGEANNSLDSSYGRGILKSTDGGVNWTLQGNAQFNRATIAKIVIDPQDANRAYAVVDGFGNNGINAFGVLGVWRTTDGGTNWSLALNPQNAPVSGSNPQGSDLVMDPTTTGAAGVLYVAYGNLFGDAGNGIYKSSDGGSTWAVAGDFPRGTTSGRIALAISTSSPGTLYAARQSPSTFGLLNILKTTNAGVNWAATTATPEDYLNGQGWYDNTIAVDPSDPNVVYAGGAGDGTGSFFVKSSNGGASWTPRTSAGTIRTGANGNGPHADHHGIGFDANGKLLVGSDGGIWRLDNPAVGSIQWTNLNGSAGGALNTIQFTGIAIHPTNPDIAIGGSQDNGTEMFLDNVGWTRVRFGDGGFARVASNSGNTRATTTVYHTYQNSAVPAVEKSIDGGVTWSDATTGVLGLNPNGGEEGGGPPPLTNGNFYVPLEISRANPLRLLVGTTQVYETTNGATGWSVVGTLPGTNLPVDSVGIADSNANTIYAASNGHVYVTADHGANWVARDPIASPSAAIEWRDFAVDPNDANTAYVVAGAFISRLGAGNGQIYKTVNAGVSWTKITGDLADIPVNTLILDTVGAGTADDRLYVGTDTGVYRSVNNGTNWTLFGTSLPNVQVVDLDYSYTTKILAAGTHGRGMWEINVNSPPTVTTIPAVAVNEDAAATVISLDSFFNDAESGAAGLAMTVQSNTSVATTSFAGHSLTLTYPLNANGAGSVTVRGTDPDGAFVDATFNVTVTAVNDAPVAVFESYSVNEDTALTVPVGTGVLANDTDVDSGSLTAVLVAAPATGTLTLNANGGFTYTPAANVNGPVTFTYKASDGALFSNTVTVTINIAAVNDAPVAVLDNYTVNEDTALTVPAGTGVLANDTDVEGTALTATLVTDVASGSLALNANGGFTYTPVANFNGPVTFTYKASDGALFSNTVTVTINIAAVNDAPVAVLDNYAVNEDTPLTVSPGAGVLANDTDVEGTALAAVLVSAPATGSLTLNGTGGFSYTPALNVNGAVTFTYKANDGAADSNVVTVTINIAAVNDAPAAAADNYNGTEDTTLVVPLASGLLTNDSDTENDALTAILVSPPSSGSLSFSGNGNFSYTPAPDFFGPMTFTYKVSDGSAESAPATVTLNIAGVNDVPVAADDPDYTTAEDTPLVVPAAAGVMANDSDADGNPLTASIVSGSGPALGDLTLNADGSFRYVPLLNYFGTISFQYKLNDGTADSNVATVTITITPVNDVPVARPDSYAVNEDGTLTVELAASVLVNDSDDDGTPLISELVDGPAHGTLQLDGDGGFAYDPAPDFFGTDTFTYKATDGVADSNVVTVTITVTAVNDPPTLTPIADLPLAEDAGPTLVSLFGIAAGGGEAQSLTVTAVSDTPALIPNPTVSYSSPAAGGSISFTPAADASGTALVTVTVNDGVTTTSRSFTVTVTAVNDTPSFTKGGDVYVVKNAGPRTVTPWATAVTVGPPDESAQAPTFLVTAVDPSLFAAGPAVAADGALTFTPADNAVGETVVRVSLQDTGGGADTSAEQTFRISIGLNRAPTLDGSGAPALTPVASDATDPLPTAVGAFAAIGAADADGTALGGAAVTAADTAHGRWEFSINAGQTWQTLAPVSLGAARLLRPQDLVRFFPTTPAGYVGSAALGYRAWDQSGGAAGDVVNLTGQTGGSTSFSAGAGTATLRVAPVFANQSEDKAPGGTAVGTRPGVADADGPVQKLGVAVIGSGGPVAGRWEYKAGGAWKKFAAIDPAHAVLLRSTDKLRFVPAKNQYGDAFLAFRAWDQSAGKAGTTEDLSSGASVGGATPFSNVVDYLFTRVAPVNDRPILDVAAATVLTRVPTTATNPAGDRVSAIVGATVTDVDPKDIPGLAVTAAGKTGGEWQYSLDGGLNWIPVLTGPPSPPNPKLPALSATSALPLGPNDLLRFVPTPGSVGGMTTLSYRVWDGSAGVHGVRANTNAGTAFSAGKETAALEVTDVSANANTAPVLNVAPPIVLSPVAEDTVAKRSPAISPAGDPVSVLLGAASDTDLDAKKGAAITTLSGTTTGVWQFSFDGKTWKPVGAVSEASALLLRDTDRLRYLPAKNFTGAVGVTFRAWDQTRGTVGGRAGLAVPGTTGGATPFSAGAGTATLAVTSTPDAPVLSLAPKPVFTTVAPGATNPAGDLVSRLLGKALTDPDANALKGIAVVSAPTTHGMWEFKAGAGAWVPFNTATAISSAHALFLQDTDLVRFKPASGFTGKVSLAYNGWDQSAGPLVGNYGRTADFGTAVSKAKVTATVSVTAVNTSPVLDTKPDVRLPAVPVTGAGNTNPAGTSAAALLGAAVTDPDPSTLLPGIAITAVSDVDHVNGVWEYSTNNGSMWTAVTTVGTPIPKGKGLLLRATDLIRFRPNAGYVGSATFSYKAWDRTTGGSAGVQAPTSTPAFSTAFETATVAVNTAPTVTY